MIVAVSLETGRQNIADQIAISPPGTGPAAERPGSYRNESVTPTPENSVLTKAGASETPRTNLQDLAQRVRDEPAGTTSALYQTLANLPEADKTPLPQMYQFVDGLAELAGDGASDEAGKTEEGEYEVDGEQRSERERASVDDNDGRVSTGGDGGGHGHDDDAEAQQRRAELENAIHKALGKFNNNADKAAAIAMARGYFEARGADPHFLNLLNALSGQFEGVSELSLAQLAAAQEALLAAATLESSPAAVRKRYRKRLREKPQSRRIVRGTGPIGIGDQFSGPFCRDWLRSRRRQPAERSRLPAIAHGRAQEALAVEKRPRGDQGGGSHHRASFVQIRAQAGAAYTDGVLLVLLRESHRQPWRRSIPARPAWGSLAGKPGGVRKCVKGSAWPYARWHLAHDQGAAVAIHRSGSAVPSFDGSGRAILRGVQQRLVEVASRMRR
jgi:hypothetical protein